MYYSMRQAFLTDICNQLDAINLSSENPKENWTVFHKIVHSSAATGEDWIENSTLKSNFTKNIMNFKTPLCKTFSSITCTAIYYMVFMAVKMAIYFMKIFFLFFISHLYVILNYQTLITVIYYTFRHHLK